MLRDRHAERDALDLLLAAARSGQSGVLVVVGEPGIGKTALLEYAVHSASGFRVSRAIGVESEVELPFAGLHQLCGQMLGEIEQLPEPQREALATAFGMSVGRCSKTVAACALVVSLREPHCQAVEQEIEWSSSPGRRRG